MKHKTPKPKINNKKLFKNVLKAQNGDKKALEYIINETGSYVYYYCLSLLKDEEKANDAVQDIYVTVLNKLSSVKNPNAFLGWLKAVTANYCKDIFAKSVTEEELTEDFEDTDIQIIPENSVETNEICNIIRNVVDKLPNVQRECVLMYYFQQLSVKEISDVLEVKEGTVKSRLYTARKAIKSEFEKIGKENLLALIPTAYIAYTLINEAEKYKCTLAPKSIFALKTFSTNGNILSVAKTASAGSAGMGVKALAVACAAVIAGGGGIFTYNLFNNKTAEQKTVESSTTAQASGYRKQGKYISKDFALKKAKNEIKKSEFYDEDNVSSCNLITAKSCVNLISDKKILKNNNLKRPVYIVILKNHYENYVEKIPKSFDFKRLSSIAIKLGLVWKDEKGNYFWKYPYLSIYSIIQIDAVTGEYITAEYEYIQVWSKEQEKCDFYDEINNRYGINKKEIKWKNPQR